MLIIIPACSMSMNDFFSFYLNDCGNHSEQRNRKYKSIKHISRY